MSVYENNKPLPGTERTLASEETKKRRRLHRSLWKKNGTIARSTKPISTIYGKRAKQS